MDERDGEAVSDELADVLIYALRLADVLGLDVEAAIRAKIAKNAQRYTVDRSYGSAAKQ
jgi:NTP pyrophosphatase (non-canonical NTP hydrolase)